MKIIVCIKQVPETGNVKIDPQTHTLIRSGVPSIINPLDTYAIEEALRWKEKLGASTLVLSMGPPQAEEALREAVSMGIDQALLLTDRRFAGADTYATAYTLSLAIRKLAPYDLIFCGKQAIDGDTAQVGPALAEHLGIPHIAYVKKIEDIDLQKATVRAHRLMEDGYEILDSRLPALLTVVKEINEPRFPSLKGKMRAKKLEIPIWGADDLGGEVANFGLSGSPTQVKGIFAPPARGKGEILTGEAPLIAQTLIERLKAQKII
ncbi:MAG: electron transfer flavoprotein subunit beta/FixA family protein [bacterium]|nr:electron transfer flavoprotein subunit beta/FixA family protein [bacterium]